MEEDLKWIIGQFQAIRLYTQDGKIAAACADGEAKAKELLEKLSSNNALLTGKGGDNG